MYKVTIKGALGSNMPSLISTELDSALFDPAQVSLDRRVGQGLVERLSLGKVSEGTRRELVATGLV